MRTRRSWRNQDRLFRELFKPAPIKVEPVAPKSDGEIDAMWWVSKQSRALLKRDAAKKRAAA